MRHRHPLRSIRVLLRSRWFVVGLVIATAAGALHIGALALAPISIVQAVMAGGLVILAVLAEPIFGWQVSGRQWSGVILSAIGLALLGITLPAIDGAHNHFSVTTMTAFEAFALIGSVVLLIAPRFRRLAAHDGALIGAASGVMFGIADIAVKAMLGTAHTSILAALLSVWLPVAVGAGMLAQYVSARSLQTGDAVSVTALTGVAVTIINIIGGIIVFGDPLAHGPAGTLAEALAFALICSAALLTPMPAGTARTPSAAAAA
jgi:drug/metabolite transporter (DMT)-like permease